MSTRRKAATEGKGDDSRVRGRRYPVKSSGYGQSTPGRGASAARGGGHAAVRGRGTTRPAHSHSYGPQASPTGRSPASVHAAHGADLDPRINAAVEEYLRHNDLDDALEAFTSAVSSLESPRKRRRGMSHLCIGAAA